MAVSLIANIIELVLELLIRNSIKKKTDIEPNNTMKEFFIIRFGLALCLMLSITSIIAVNILSPKTNEVYHIVYTISISIATDVLIIQFVLAIIKSLIQLRKEKIKEKAKNESKSNIKDSSIKVSN